MTTPAPDLDAVLAAVKALHPGASLRRAAIVSTQRRVNVPADGRVAALANILADAGAQACWLWQMAAPVHAAAFSPGLVQGVLLAAEAVIDGASALTLRHRDGDDWMVGEVREAGENAPGAVSVIAEDGGAVLIEGEARAYGYVRYWGFDEGRARPVATRFTGYVEPLTRGERR